jgi:hypothetical protein
VTDHFSIMFGSVVPLWFVSSGWNVLGGVKFGGSLGEHVHLAAGAQGLLFPAVSSTPLTMVMGFGTATFGTPDRHLTLTAGTSLNAVGYILPHLRPIVVVGGAIRVAPHMALQTENWLFPTLSAGSEPFFMLNSAGVRFMNGRLATDLGLVRVAGSLIPIPWVDFTYSFGG